MFENKNKSLLLCTVMLSALLAVSTDAAEIENHITHGPILGRVSSSTVGVWVRTAEPGGFQVHYGTDSANLDQLSAVVQTKLDSDCTGWVLLQNLDSRTKYYYRVEMPDVAKLTGRQGSFRTLPVAKQYHHKQLNPAGLFNFKFEYACGNNQNPVHSNGPQLPAFHTMLREIKDDIDFAILNGDWLYETQREYTPAQWLQQVGQPANAAPALVKTAPSIVGVWQNYKHFLNQAPVLTEWHRQVPSFFMYDDHEILNDVWGAGSPGLRDRRAVFRDIGVRAWYDYLGWANPTDFPQRVHISRAAVSKQGTILTDPTADFKSIDMAQVSNLHVHWGTRTDGVNENELDDVGGIANAGVYEIVEVMDKHRIRVEPAFDEDATV
ncbi:MAG: alkaline phosphatase D family protein, partial [Pirellulaceae bacterium]|nr:alkaline phosphatase D family protein [Pirellulaceae bacterium]